MVLSRFIVPKGRTKSQPDGFSLVEVVLALGVVSLAVLCIASLMPVGLATFQKGMKISISEQILQKVISDAQQTDYATLVDLADWAGASPANFRGPLIAAPALRYYDSQGDELSSSTGSIYQVNTVIVPKAVYYPVSGSSMSLPATVLVKVEVAVNPGNVVLQFSNDGTINSSSTPNLNIFRGVTLVAQSR